MAKYNNKQIKIQRHHKRNIILIGVLTKVGR